MLESRINRVCVRNYRSLGDVEVELNDLTVLVGPNGSGKSNFLDVFRFVSDALTKGLDAALQSHDRGGFNQLARWSATEESQLLPIEIVLELEIEGIKGNYQFSLGYTNEKLKKTGVLLEKFEFGESHFTVEKGRVAETNLDGIFAAQDRNLLLPLLSGLANVKPIYDFLSQMGFYNIFPQDMRKLKGSISQQGYPLRNDGTNLIETIHHIRENYPENFTGVSEVISRIIPNVSAVLTSNPETISGDLDVYFVDSNRLAFALGPASDGTLRILGILTALYQAPSLPLIGIEEPEVMIHPGALEMLSEVIEEAALRSQIILTTHSPDLISQFEPETLRLVEIEDGGTQIGRISEADIDAINEKLFSGGDLLRIGGLQRE